MSGGWKGAVEWSVRCAGWVMPWHHTHVHTGGGIHGVNDPTWTDAVGSSPPKSSVCYITSITDKTRTHSVTSRHWTTAAAAAVKPKKPQKCPHVSLNLWRKVWRPTCRRPSSLRSNASCSGRKQSEFVARGLEPVLQIIVFAFTLLFLFTLSLVTYYSAERTLVCFVRAAVIKSQPFTCKEEILLKLETCAASVSPHGCICAAHLVIMCVIAECMSSTQARPLFIY